ncbi:MAG: hypothetical protein E4G99_00680 [Anaerolineales bacterium]|nr:MAG: hypothetical protein E4G99_00680 [Anaerolineales bacterium]
MQSKNHVWPAISLSVIALVSGACGTASLTPDSGEDDVTIIQDASSGEVLFFDDFSDPSSGWKVDDIYYFRGYDDDAYRISIDQDESQYVILTAVSNHSYGDVRIEVDVNRVSGSDSAGIYVICRYQDNDNYYYAEIDGEGLLAVAAFFEGEQVVLIDDFPTDVILERNHFEVDCIGTEMTVYIDDVQVLSAAPLKILQGDAGFGAGGSGRGLTDVRFDNFTVSAP